MNSLRAFTFTVLFIATLGSGCVPPPATSDAGTDDVIPVEPLRDSGSATDGTCHFDCFGSKSCYDGVVTITMHAPVPCNAWEGACPVVETYSCTQGCMAEGAFQDDFRGAVTACVEGAPKHVGFPCSSDSDCLPTRSESDGGSSVWNSYLTCDLDAGSCVDAPAPEVEGWLGKCRPKVQAQAGNDTVATFVEDETCPRGYCLFTASPDDCLKQTCTALCSGTHECPQDSICERNAVLFDGGWMGACKPGGQYVSGYGLTCFPR